MAGIFKFKQFNVDQAGCAMKVNTDGVLLGAQAGADSPENIIDIGTGTGVIALMLAQRFPGAHIDAVEIDEQAAQTAASNFSGSPFGRRLTLHKGDFAMLTPADKYDLIVSNPPFFLDSLTSADTKKNLARHTDHSFFERLMNFVAASLTANGTCQLIVPLPTAQIIQTLLFNYQLHLQGSVTIRSFNDSEPHREIIIFGRTRTQLLHNEIVIYDAPKVYAKEYQYLLQDFLTIF